MPGRRSRARLGTAACPLLLLVRGKGRVVQLLMPRLLVLPALDHCHGQLRRASRVLNLRFGASPLGSGWDNQRQEPPVRDDLLQTGPAISRGRCAQRAAPVVAMGTECPPNPKTQKTFGHDEVKCMASDAWRHSVPGHLECYRINRSADFPVEALTTRCKPLTTAKLLIRRGLRRQCCRCAAPHLLPQR